MLSRGGNFARDDFFDSCAEMLVANIGGLCDLGKFCGRDIAFISKRRGVYSSVLVILSSRFERLLKRGGVFGFSPLFALGRSEGGGISLVMTTRSRGGASDIWCDAAIMQGIQP